MDYRTSVLESQLDWITASVRGDKKVSNLRLFAGELVRMEHEAKDRTVPFHTYGYVGYMCGRVRYGERSGSALVQLSGDLAENWAAELFDQADHVTRVDLAVTVKLDPADHRYGDTVWQEAGDFWRANRESARPLRHMDVEEGDTIELGSRRSPLHLRVYDKEAEQAAYAEEADRARYAGAWRYELETHDSAAQQALVGACAHTPRSHYVEAVLHDYLSSHGIRPLFRCLSDPMHLGGFRRRSDYQTRLKWLGRSVAPAVRWMIDRGDRGQIVDALGLSPGWAEEH